MRIHEERSPLGLIDCTGLIFLRFYIKYGKYTRVICILLGCLKKHSRQRNIEKKIIYLYLQYFIFILFCIYIYSIF